MTSPIIPVLDENEEQTANGQIRLMPDGNYLYVDDVDGFDVIDALAALTMIYD